MIYDNQLLKIMLSNCYQFIPYEKSHISHRCAKAEGLNAEGFVILMTLALHQFRL
jgi:hypothetical protein